MAMKLQIFTIKNRRIGYNYTCLAVVTLDITLKKDDIYYPQVFLKECKYIEKIVVRHIHRSVSDFSYYSDESEEE